MDGQRCLKCPDKGLPPHAFTYASESLDPINSQRNRPGDLDFSPIDRVDKVRKIDAAERQRNPASVRSAPATRANVVLRCVAGP